MAPASFRKALPVFAFLTVWLAQDDRTYAQVAFAPTVSSFPNGVTLNATPVVSADRRYVRMT